MSDEKRVVWVPDRDCNECTACKIEFSFFNRKHHCRLCGLIFCEKCCSCYLKVASEGSLSPLISQKKRCCIKCSHKMIAKSNLPHSPPLIVDSDEYLEGEPYKLFSVNVPWDIKPHQILRVSVDSRLLTVHLPYSVCPGDSIHIKAPLPVEVAEVEVVNEQQRILSNYVDELEFASSHHEDSEKVEGTIECSRCTFKNKPTAILCEICEATLLDNTVV